MGNQFITGIIGSVIAGFITIGLVYFYRQYQLCLLHLKFVRIFGEFDSNNFHIILPSLILRPDVERYLLGTPIAHNRFPFLVESRPDYYIKSSKFLAYCDMVASKYILDILASNSKKNTILSTDFDLNNNLNISFIAIGGNNFYCRYILNHQENRFYTLNDNSITKIINNETTTINNDHDYGLIIKFTDPNFTDKIWIIIAGIGEWGTRGAAWYLSYNWKKLSNRHKNNSFGLMVRVNHNVENSARLIDEISH